MINISKEVRVVLLISYLCLITVLSLISFSTVENEIKIDNFDKIVHFLFYFGLSILALFYLAKYKKITNRNLLFVVLLVIFYSGIIELIQPLFNRSSDVVDFITNICGAVTGSLLYKAVISRFDK